MYTLKVVISRKRYKIVTLNYAELSLWCQQSEVKSHDLAENVTKLTGSCFYQHLHVFPLTCRVRCDDVH